MNTRAGSFLLCALLLTVAALYWLPEHVAAGAGWYPQAVDYVVSRLELAALWLAVAGWLASRWWSRGAAPVAVWAAIEAGVGAAARLALPMCCPLTDRDRPLAVQAWGEWTQWASLMLAGLVLWWVIRLMRHAQPGREVAHGQPGR